MLSNEQNQNISSIPPYDNYAWVSQRAWVEINLVALSNNIVKIRNLL